MNYHLRLAVIFISCFLLFSQSVAAAENSLENWRLHEITPLENGFLKKTDGDPYIVFPEITESTCAPMGVQLSISFAPALTKPLLLEIFWSTDYLGFGEENKVFFVVHPNKSGTPNKIVVPLDHTAGFTQIRLDFPSYIDASFKVEDYEIVSLSNIDQKFEKVDAYYNLSVKDSLEPEIIIPYVLHALSHGPKRMAHDFAFLAFWLLLIISLLFLIRFTVPKKSGDSY